MSSYTKFITKEIKLRKDTPQEVIDFIDILVNDVNWKDRNCMPPLPEHKLFKLERWDSIFDRRNWYWLKERSYFKKEDRNECCRLIIRCEINHGKEEIREFAKWITPYVIGHKPKEFIGTYQGEERQDRGNIYIERERKWNKQTIPSGYLKPVMKTKL